MPNYRQVRYSFGGAFTPAVKVLIIANTAIWFAMQPLLETVLRLFALQPALVLRGQIWQLVTYLFLHPGIIHLLFNMYGLYLFGGQMEGTWGTKRFLRFFFLTGVVAGVVVVVANPGAAFPVVGDSCVAPVRCAAAFSASTWAFQSSSIISFFSSGMASARELIYPWVVSAAARGSAGAAAVGGAVPSFLVRPVLARLWATAAPTNPANSGCGDVGFDLNSG